MQREVGARMRFEGSSNRNAHSRTAPHRTFTLVWHFFPRAMGKCVSFAEDGEYVCTKFRSMVCGLAVEAR